MGICQGTCGGERDQELIIFKQLCITLYDKNDENKFTQIRCDINKNDSYMVELHVDEKDPTFLFSNSTYLP